LTEFTLDRHPAVVRFDELLDDGEAETHAASLVRIGLQFVEHLPQTVCRNPRAVVTYPAFDGGGFFDLLRSDTGLSVRGVVDGEGGGLLVLS